jgi:hypothetical protein
MKKTAILFLSIFICAALNAEISSIPFSPKEFDVDIYQYPYMILVDNPKSEQVDTYYTFTNESGDYQVRYTFFTHTEKDFKNIEPAYFTCIFAVISNAAGYELDPNAIVDFKNDDVKQEFNGDFGTTTFIQDPKSDYGEGFKYMLLNTYYKENQGIVFQTILFNDDEKVLNSPEFIELFHSFRFHE